MASLLRLVATVLAVSVSVALACSCAPRTQQNAFDAAAIVAHVKVDLVQKNATTYTYVIEYVEPAFKPRGVRIALPSRITTASQSAACGVTTLKKGAEYLVAGPRAGPNIGITQCSGIPLKDNTVGTGAVLWSKVPAALKKKLRSGGFTATATTTAAAETTTAAATPKE